jgi:hypothetical protein
LKQDIEDFEREGRDKETVAKASATEKASYWSKNRRIA